MRSSEHLAVHGVTCCVMLHDAREPDGVVVYVLGINDVVGEAVSVFQEGG